jgi:hypothetical protein
MGGLYSSRVNPEHATPTYGKFEMVSEIVAAQIVGARPATLRRWRFDGRGPRYLKIGDLCRYRIEDLQEFLAQCTVETRDSRRQPEEVCV